MKQILLLIILLFFSLILKSQTDTTNIGPEGKLNAQPAAKVVIYPVPVRNGVMNIKSDREFTEIKITNIIGQDIQKIRYNDPVNYARIEFEKPGRGIYLVAVMYNNRTLAVRKIMVEDTR